MIGDVMKKVAHTSNLAMRFYVRDGWTKGELDECIVRGEFIIAHPEDTNPYYSIGPHDSYDSKKLLEKISKIKRGFDDQNQYSDYELLEHMNWG